MRSGAEASALAPFVRFRAFSPPPPANIRASAPAPKENTQVVKSEAPQTRGVWQRPAQARPTRLLDGCQRLLDVLDEVLDVFQADRQANQTRGDAHGGQLLVGNLAVRGRRRV